MQQLIADSSHNPRTRVAMVPLAPVITTVFLRPAIPLRCEPMAATLPMCSEGCIIHPARVHVTGSLDRTKCPRRHGGGRPRWWALRAAARGLPPG
jgi:hypothetical protein